MRGSARFGAHVYILRCADGSYYVGLTRQEFVETRISQHQQGLIPGYTSTRRPVKAVWSEHIPRIIDAIDAENMLATVIEITGHVAPFNATGVPATAQPVPVAGGGLPASLQLVGPLGGEELLLTTAQRVETAVGG